MIKFYLICFSIVFFLNITLTVDVYYVDVYEVPLNGATATVKKPQPQRRPVQVPQRSNQRPVAQPVQKVVRQQQQRPAPQRQQQRPAPQRQQRRPAPPQRQQLRQPQQQFRQPQTRFQQQPRQQQPQRISQQPQRRAPQQIQRRPPQQVQRRPVPQQIPEIDTIIVIEEPDDIPLQPRKQQPLQQQYQVVGPAQQKFRPQNQAVIASKQSQGQQQQQQNPHKTVEASTTSTQRPIAPNENDLDSSTTVSRISTTTTSTESSADHSTGIDHTTEEVTASNEKSSNLKSNNTSLPKEEKTTTLSPSTVKTTKEGDNTSDSNKDDAAKKIEKGEENASNNNNVDSYAENRGENFDSNFWFNAHRPQQNHYLDFAGIFNEIGQKVETDYDTSMEENEIKDDFNGRSVVAPGQYPHMAALGYRTYMGETEFMCGGSLISELFVLTAAHCCFLNGEAPHLVKIGEIRLKDKDNYVWPQQRGIARVISHPFYNKSMYYNDIGLLELANPVDFTFFVQPIRLWAQDELPYDKVFTMGYGSTSFAKAPTNVLTELDLTVVSLDVCNKTLPHDPHSPYGLRESQMCAKDFESNRDTCQGDSGGPLQLNLERPRRRLMRYYLVGVISYGTFCGSEHPGVYTRVSSYIDWIASVVWPEYFNSFL